MTLMKEMALWHMAVNLLRNDSECNWGVESKEGLEMWRKTSLI